MRRATKRSLVIAACAPPDRHGYFSLGPHAEYVASMIGEAPFFLEANAQMPRMFGEHQVHVSQVVGWCEADYPLIEAPSRPATETDRRIAELVVERIPDGATIQAGIGSVPDPVLNLLSGHRELGVHTELMSDGFVDLIEGGAITGTRKATHRNRVITTSVFGSKRLLDFAAENPGIELLAGRLHQRPTQHRPRARDDRDQRDARGRLPRPVRLGVAGHRLLVVVGRPGRLHPRGAVRRERAVVHRPALDAERRVGLADRPHAPAAEPR